MDLAIGLLFVVAAIALLTHMVAIQLRFQAQHAHTPDIASDSHRKGDRTRKLIGHFRYP